MQMTTKMQRFYTRYTELSRKSDWKIDSYCAIYSTQQRSFCRGKITAFKSHEKAEVFLYDLALTEVVHVNDLRTLSNNFWITRPYALKIKLGGILPCGGSSTWLSSSTEALKDFIEENQTSKFYISKVVSPLFLKMF